MEDSDRITSEQTEQVLDRAFESIRYDVEAGTVAPDALAAACRRFRDALTEADPITRQVARGAAINWLSTPEYKIRGAAALIDACLNRNGKARGPSDPEPATDSQDGAMLLDALAGWFSRYVYLPRHGATVCALWAALTWFVERCYFAPILAILSATKQCGKTLVLDLLRTVVRRGDLTSASGVTVPVIFRKNDKKRPTFLIDEAEKLAGRNADQELIGLLNVGYRRGAVAQRCVEANGDYVIRDFDAFGFRALAAIGGLWDTVRDRAVTLQLERKPVGVRVARFSGRVVVAEGASLARRLRRWTDDTAEAFGELEPTSERPEWLSDRACDNWSGLFAVAALAGGPWPERARDAARALQPAADEEGDRGERLVHDVRAVFKAMAEPEAIQSGELVQKLNEIETAPWGDERRGDGLSTHALAGLLRRFGVRPRKDRLSGGGGAQLRGYWLADLKPVFERYPPPPPPGKPSQLSQPDRVSQLTIGESRGYQPGTVGTVTGSGDSRGGHEAQVERAAVQDEDR